MVQQLYTLTDNPDEYVKYACTGQNSELIVGDVKLVCKSRLELIEVLNDFDIIPRKLVKDMLSIRLNIGSFEDSCNQTKVKVNAVGHRARQPRSSLARQL